MRRARVSSSQNRKPSKAALKNLGVRATVRVPANALQVVLGPVAGQAADEIRTLLCAEGAGRVQAPASQPSVACERTSASIEPEGLRSSPLGGRENVREAEVVASNRLQVRVTDADAIDERALEKMGALLG